MWHGFGFNLIKIFHIELLLGLGDMAKIILTIILLISVDKDLTFIVIIIDISFKFKVGMCGSSHRKGTAPTMNTIVDYSRIIKHDFLSFKLP